MPKSKPKRIFVIVIAVVLTVVVLREMGIVDLNLYKSTLSTDFTASKSMQHNGGKEARHSWDITISNGDRTVFKHSFRNGGAAPIAVSGELEEPKFTGNYYYPLRKQFTMTCRLDFAGSNETDSATVEGEMDIEVAAEIRGFCTRSKARSLAIEEANKTVANYFSEQFRS